jgi:hypothetical protein
MMYKPPYLQKYAGKSTRFTCPGCKTPYSFTRYLDGETHQPIHPTVGRCNREIKCGYHYTPRQYFTDIKRQETHAPTTNQFDPWYPDLHSPSTQHATTGSMISPSNFPQYDKPLPLDSNHFSSQPKSHPPVPQHQKSLHLQSKLQTSHSKSQTTVPRPLYQYPVPGSLFLTPQPSQQKTPDYIPHKYLKRSLSYNSHFVRFLRKHFSDLQIAEAANNYLLGATTKKEVIFWQVDIHGKVRTGKIMKYNPTTGRRIKTGYGGINWVHHKLKKSNPSFSDFNLSQCYFGEHLLRLYPDKPVAIVEAEKTAVIASIIYQDYNWLAAGNLNGLNVEKSRVLRNKTVILYPDAGCYNRWLRKAEQINRELPLHLTVSAFLERFATPIQTHHGYDLADYIIKK